MRLGEHFLVLSLALGLTWLLFMGLAPRDPALSQAVRDLSAYSEVQGHLRADVLAARAGTLRSYDPLVENLGAMRAAVARLRSRTEARVAGTLVAALEQSLDEQEALIEQLKTRNALLQNSLTYLSLFSARSATSPESRELKIAAGAAWGAVMRLTLDTSPPAVEEARQRLARLERMCSVSRCSTATTDLLAHGKLLSRQLPAVDALVDSITARSHREVIARLSEHLAERQRSVDQRTLRFRLLLYLASLLLLYLVGRWGMRLRSQTRLLSSQAALEHAVAALSAGLIGASGEGLRRAIATGLAKIGASLDAATIAYHSARMGDFWPGDTGGPDLHGLVGALPGGDSSGEGGDGVARYVRLDPAELPEGLGTVLPGKRARAAFCLFGRNAQAADFLLIVPGEEGLLHPSLLPVLQTAHDAIGLAIEQAHAESERLALERQVRHARRMQTIGVFTSGIAHNFNNLLGAIIGNAELAQARLQQAGASTGNADEILLTAERARALVDNLLDYGRRPDRQRRWVPLEALVDETVRIASAAMSGRSIEVMPGPGGTRALIDPVQMQQVLLNLCHNADQASPTGRPIRIVLDSRVLAAPFHHAHGTIAAGHYVQVAVRDTGPGMSREVLQRVFEPFYTTRPSGTGLGLATAREIVREAGGEIVIESREGEGAEAQVWLPAELAQRRARPASSSTVRLRGAGETVLFLAASEPSRLAGEELLAALGYEPAGYSSLDLALAACRREPGRFDAIVAEHSGSEEPFLCGGEQARWLPPVRIVASPGIVSLGPLGGACAGVAAVIRLPLDTVELATELHRHLGARRTLPQAS